MEVEEALKRKRSPSPESSCKRFKEAEEDEKTEELEEEEKADDDMFWQTSWLPNDILFSIMYRLCRMDLVSCRTTCKQWKQVCVLNCTGCLINGQVSLDERLNWLTITIKGSSVPSGYGLSLYDTVLCLSLFLAIEEARFVEEIQEVLKEDPELKHCKFELEGVSRAGHLVLRSQITIYLKRETKPQPICVGSAYLTGNVSSNASMFLASMDQRPKDMYRFEVIPSISAELEISWEFRVSVNVWMCDLLVPLLIS